MNRIINNESATTTTQHPLKAILVGKLMNRLNHIAVSLGVDIKYANRGGTRQIIIPWNIGLLKNKKRAQLWLSFYYVALKSIRAKYVSSGR